MFNWAAYKDDDWKEELEVRDVQTTALTEGNMIGGWDDGGRRRNHLRDNAAATVSSSCINGSGGGGLGLGGVGGDGEEVNEEIHWCDCGVWFDRCDETVLMLKSSSILSFYTLQF